VVPLSKNLDHVGVLARSVADAAIVFQEMATSRLRLIDPLTLHVEVPAPRALRVGIETDYFASGAQPAVAASVSSATAALSAAGCQIVEVALPEAAAWRAGAKVILLYEAWQYHAARLTAGAPYGPVFRTAVEAGADLPADAYRKALDVRSRARESMNTLFAKVDVILTPTCPTIAPAIEEGRRSVAYNRYTTLAAFTGIPAISVPIGLGHLGLPIGAQLMAAPGAERTLVGAAALLESEVSPSTPFG
jgi:aspartyl-tRNA(Asn)/glutamyl-tRNA(Gln) amidotransferase subunit A